MRTLLCFVLILAELMAPAIARDLPRQQRFFEHSPVFLNDAAVGKAEPRDDAEDVDIHKISLLPSPPRVQATQRDWVQVEQIWINERYLMRHREAVEYLTEKTQTNPKDAKAWWILATAWKLENGCEQKAIECLDKAIELEPNVADGYIARAELRLSQDSNDVDASIRDYQKAIEINPTNAATHNALAIRFGWKSDVENQIKSYSEAIRLDPSNPVYFYNRRSTWMAIGDVDKAVLDAEEIIRFTDAHPEEREHYASVYNDVAWTMATWPNKRYRDGKKAIEYATKACEFTKWNDWKMIATLAAAHAEVGDFDHAVEQAKSALNQLKKRIKAARNRDSHKDPSIDSPQTADFDIHTGMPYVQSVPQVKRQLELYEAKQPYRDASPYNEIAWIKACSSNAHYRNVREAVEYAKTACEWSDFKDWQFLDTLAAAYAESNDFQKAIETQELAIKLWPQECPQDQFKQLQSRLALYRNNKPYRDAR